MTAPGQAPELHIEGAIATITLRRPEVSNRLELQDLRALREQIDEVNASAPVRVLRLTGSGRYFCSGFNVGSIGASADGSGFEALADALEQARPVTVAGINGGLYGGACDLALACDFRIGVQHAEMFVPAARLGLHFYRSGMQRFVSRLGVDAAKRVLLTCDKLDAAEMLRCGFLNALHDDAQAMSQAMDALSLQLSRMAPLSLLPMKQHLNAMARHTLDEQAIARDIQRAATSQDLREGGAAFREKRAPNFLGH